MIPEVKTGKGGAESRRPKRMRGASMGSRQSGEERGRAAAPAGLTAARLAAVTVVALTVANCGSQQKVAGRSIDPRYGVAASPRVVEEGEPVPKGGGRELVGRPYQIAGKTYYPREDANGYSRVGLASWYGSAFHGRLTANGEVFDRYSVAAAHATLPLPSYARVTNIENGRSLIVRVNDRGPYHANRLMDVSERVAEALEFKRVGTARVRVDYVGRASTRGSDDQKLMATLRTDGSPAPFPGASRTMFAGLQEPEPVARAAPAQALAWPVAEPVEHPQPRLAARAAEPAPVRQAPIEVAAAEPPDAGRAVPGVPLPPERPFDLGTIPNAATPIPVASLAPLPPRRTVAGLFYAEPDKPRTRMAKADPFKDLKPQPVIPLKLVP
jgi:rare lipoprotein A